MNQKQSSRLLSLDVLRGITIAGMLLVNNPGTWSSIYAPLRHADWNGLTPTDLVFPFFMFIMGVSTYISLRKTEFKFTSEALFKIMKRTFVIFSIGIALSWIGVFIGTYNNLEVANISIWKKLLESVTNFEHIRILGVMQRLAFTYCAASLIAILIKHKYIPAIVVSLLLGYSIFILVGNGYAQDGSSWLAIVDQNVLGLNHMYSEYGVDPEGILSTIPAIAHVLIGFCMGNILMNIKDNRERMLQLFIYGAIFTFLGFLLSYAFPINKKIWSPSFVLVTCGMGATLLSLLIWIIDVNNKKKWSIFFESFGANPLFLYVFGAFLGTLIDTVNVNNTTLKSWMFNGMLSLNMNVYFTSCLFAILFVVACWIMGYPLYKRGIYIKI
ncbi:MAG: DUF5009 domain-containing protein [Dysgonomonas sp.]|nr:DUF5009 domain-containing protein [Dysgonomonas sp.]